MYILFCFFFFFSSRRRHTRWPRDWSSDVCSSDLKLQNAVLERVTKDDRPIASGFSVHLCRCCRCRTQQEQQRKKKADFLEIEVHRSVLKKFWTGGATGVPARPLRKLGVVQSEETEGTCPLPTAGLVISERKFQRHLPYPAITGASNLAEVAVDFAGD